MYYQPWYAENNNSIRIIIYNLFKNSFEPEYT